MRWTIILSTKRPSASVSQVCQLPIELLEATICSARCTSMIKRLGYHTSALRTGNSKVRDLFLCKQARCHVTEHLELCAGTNGIVEPWMVFSICNKVYDRRSVVCCSCNKRRTETNRKTSRTVLNFATPVLSWSLCVTFRFLTSRYRNLSNSIHDGKPVCRGIV